MSISFKQFVHLVEMDDTEFQAFLLDEGLLDSIASLFKGPDTAAKKQKIAAAREKLGAERKALGQRRDAASVEKAKALDAALAAFASGNKPKKPGELSHGDLESALSADDRKFNAKMDRMRTQ